MFASLNKPIKKRVVKVFRFVCAGHCRSLASLGQEG